MSTRYRIEPAGEQFTVIDSDSTVVDIVPTRETAETVTSDTGRS